MVSMGPKESVRKIFLLKSTNWRSFGKLRPKSAPKETISYKIQVVSSVSYFEVRLLTRFFWS